MKLSKRIIELASGFSLYPSGRAWAVRGGALGMVCALVACSAASDVGEEIGDSADSLAGTTTHSFQNGVYPSTSYAGAHDSFLAEAAPTTTNGTATTLKIDGDGGSGADLATLLSWDVSSIPAGSIVRGVSMTLSVTNATGNDFQVYALKRRWSESETTWNAAASGTPWSQAGAKGVDDRSSTSLGTFSPGATGTYTLSLNAAGVAVVQGWVNDPSSNHGFVLANATSADGVALASSESTTTKQRPRLSIGYDAPGGTSGTSTAPVGNLPGWRQVFVEDLAQPAALGGFMTSPYYGARFKRTYPFPWKDTSKHGTYDPPKTMSVANDLLNIDMHTEGSEICIGTVEPTLAIPTRGQTYGRYAVRFRSNAVAGFKTAWLLWPDSGLRSEGEIDFPEGNLDGTIKAFMHHASNDGTASSLGTQDAFSTGASYTAWHTAVIEWTPGKVQFFLDGTRIGTSTTKVPSRPMHWVLQSETALSGALPSKSAHAHVDIDWVAAWAYAP